jgi:hypothetical protein
MVHPTGESKDGVLKLRSRLHAAIVRLRLSTGTGRNTLAIDAGGADSIAARRTS